MSYSADYARELEAENATLHRQLEAVEALCDEIERGGNEASKLPGSFVAETALFIVSQLRTALAASVSPQPRHADGTPCGSWSCPLAVGATPKEAGDE